MTLPSGMVTFLFTDIEGSSSKWDEARASMEAAVRTHDSIMDQAISDHGGHLVKKLGDGMMAAFPDPADALKAATSAQRQIESSRWEGIGGQLRVRMGVHTGPGEPVENDYVGPSPNRAARIEAAGHGGQILASAATRELAAGRVEGIEFRDLGQHQLRGLSRPERIYQVSDGVFDGSFPPLRTESTPTNITSAVTPLIGRGGELMRLAGVLEESRLVTVTGAGGAGKTTLAEEIGRRRIDLYPGGVWLLELAPLSDGRLIPSELLGAMRRPAPAARDPLDVLVDTLGADRVLLILDNCEHLVDAVSDVVSRVMREAPDVTVLATSREPLGIRGEQVWTIPTMGLPADSTIDAVEHSDSGNLFVARASAADRSFTLTESNAPLVVEICRRLDGLPLAIELAAARIRSMSLAELNSGLDDRFRLLRSSGRDGADHHQTLRDTVGWSYDLLDSQCQALYRNLSIFSGGFDLAAAEAVAGTDGDVLAGLDLLVAQSLVQVERGESTRYGMLETIREYGVELLQEEGEDTEVATSHLAWLETLVKEGARGLEGHDQMIWLDRFRTEIDNIRIALGWALENDPLTGAVIVSALSRFFWMYAAEGDSTSMQDSTSFLREGYDWAIAMLRAGGEDLPERVKARLEMATGGLLCIRLGRYEEALTLLENAQRIFRDAEDERNLGWTIFYTGIAAYGSVPREESIATFEKSLQLLAGSADTMGVGASTLLLALALSETNGPEAGRPLVAAFSEQAKGIPWAAAHAADSLALLDAFDRNVDETSRINAGKALVGFRQINNYACLCHAIETAGAVLAVMGDTQGAARAIGIAEATRRRLNMVISPYEDRRDQVAELAGAASGESSWEEARAEGRTFEPNEGIDWTIDRLGVDRELLEG